MTAIHYNIKIANNPDFYMAEKKRIASYIKNRYATDEVFREKQKAYCRLKMKELYNKRKLQNLI